MDAARFERLRSLFHEASGLPTVERAGYLSRVCGEDRALAAEVEGMLAADAAGPSLLDAGMPELAGSLFDGQGAAFHNLRFGPYRLLRPLGEGGMGVVYLAERQDLGSRVAIKFLRDAWLSPLRRERFAAEQRTLAQMVHPAIARLYDADTISDGTPWFAMEFVEGVAITQYLDARAAGVEERLKLFRSVCEAVQYAHERAVIHRDLKPSNILVKADGSVRLLDFGIAKHLDGEGQPADQTRTVLRLMTPAYAAPEQLRGEPVGIFTDVYALGVILYQLVSGSLPPASAGPTLTPSSVPGAPMLARSAWADLDVLCLTAIHQDAERRFLNRKQYGRAEAMYRDAIARYRTTLPAGHSYIAIAEIKLGRALVFEQRYREAERYSAAGYRDLAKQASPSVTWLQSAKQDLVTIYEALHEPEKAAAYR
ncbi:MAG: serine/threonine-protein kinase [Candidatus Solibacter sp.]